MFFIACRGHYFANTSCAGLRKKTSWRLSAHSHPLDFRAALLRKNTARDPRTSCTCASPPPPTKNPTSSARATRYSVVPIYNQKQIPCAVVCYEQNWKLNSEMIQMKKIIRTPETFCSTIYTSAPMRTLKSAHKHTHTHQTRQSYRRFSQSRISRPFLERPLALHDSSKKRKRKSTSSIQVSLVNLGPLVWWRNGGKETAFLP